MKHVGKLCMGVVYYRMYFVALSENETFKLPLGTWLRHVDQHTKT